jgi:hypothetical protein
MQMPIFITLKPDSYYNAFAHQLAAEIQRHGTSATPQALAAAMGMDFGVYVRNCEELLKVL